LAAGIEPPAKIAHSPPPQAAGQPERFSCRTWITMMPLARVGFLYLSSSYQG